MLQEEALRVAVMCLLLNGILNKVVSCYNAHLAGQADLHPSVQRCRCEILTVAGEQLSPLALIKEGVKGAITPPDLRGRYYLPSHSPTAWFLSPDPPGDGTTARSFSQVNQTKCTLLISSS